VKRKWGITTAVTWSGHNCDALRNCDVTRSMRLMRRGRMTNYSREQSRPGRYQLFSRLRTSPAAQRHRSTLPRQFCPALSFHTVRQRTPLTARVQWLNSKSRGGVTVNSDFGSLLVAGSETTKLASLSGNQAFTFTSL